MAGERDRRRAWAFGLAAETAAAMFLRLKGYRIVERRHRNPRGEIDLIARRGKTLVFAEVKARAEEETAVAAVTPRQRRRIERAAAGFLARRNVPPDAAVRFDLIAVSPWRLPRHIPDAWRPESD